MRRFPFSSLPQRLAVVVGGVALLASSLVGLGTAHASWGWCSGDPLIYVNGKSLAINIGVQGDLATVQADVLAANIVVHVPKGVTTSVGASGALPFPEHVSFVYDKGTYTSGAITVQIVTTYSLAPKTPSLNAQMSLTAWSGTTALAQATVQGSMSRNASL